MSDRYEVCGDPTRRHDFLLVFDVTDGNPNGDPDAGNMPRIDPETAQGLVTDVCIKRKVRDFVGLYKKEESPYRIYVQNTQATGRALNEAHAEAYQAEGIKSTGSKQKRDDVLKVRDRMCREYFDIRMFGAVMTTGVNAGQVRGPVQLTFARSVDPIASLEVAITRVAITKPEDVTVVAGEDEKEQRSGKVTEIGRKALLPYALYIAKGFFSPAFAEQTGVTRDDLVLFWESLERMWDQDRSAARGMLSCRGLHVFTHENPLGNAASHRLFEPFIESVRRKDGVESPRRFADYVVPTPRVPDSISGVTLTSLVEG
jgi:CRISPR-associated protein Cas7/Csd2, subtype I-C/DVULG